MDVKSSIGLYFRKSGLSLNRTNGRALLKCIVFCKQSAGKYHILASIVHTFYIENGAEIFPVHYTWKVAEKGFKIDFMMNKLAMINSFEMILIKILVCQKSL